MTKSTGQRRFHFKSMPLDDPAVKRFGDWLPANRGCYAHFRQWLRDGGYGGSSLGIYGAAARTAIGLLDKPYWTIDPQADLDRVRAHLATRPLAPVTRRMYGNGLTKLAQFLCQHCHRVLPEKQVNWSNFVGALPAWLAADVRAHVEQRCRKWRPEDRYRARLECASRLTIPLRWLAAHAELNSALDFTPTRWFAFVEARLEAGIDPVTVNGDLSSLLAFLRDLQDQGRPICERMLLVKPLDPPRRLPRDAPPEQLRRLEQAIMDATTARHGATRRLGLMDLAWFRLMLYSGLRTCEVRRLTLSEIDWERRHVRIEQSKGLKDRLVYLSPATIEALHAYLAVRGPAEALPQEMFIFKHLRLGPRYCAIRLRTYAKACGVHVTPHQLRHSCATLLLNAGAPVLTVQMLLGHQRVDTTLGYARLYHGTVAADYYRAMVQVEQRLALGEHGRISSPPCHGELIALADALRGGALNAMQAETLSALRAGLLAWAEQPGGPAQPETPMMPAG